MTEIAGSILAPYVNPAYWGGYSHGYGAVESPTSSSTTPFGKLIAYLAIQDHVISKRGVLEGVMMQPGEVFDPDAYPRGTVALLQWEDLHTHGKVAPVSPEDFEGIPIPARPSLNEELSILDEQNLRHYSTAPFLAAVGAGRLIRPSKHTLYGVPVRDIWPHEGDHIHMTSSLLPLPQPVTVGKTRHIEPNLVSRIASLKYFIPAKRQKKTVFDLGWKTRPAAEH